MNQNLEQQKNIAKTELKKLVDNFKEHIESYKAPDYNEATLRIDYLNKFFKILGWDVDNNKNLPPSYREVITEDKVQIEGRAKAPDYSFRLENGKRLFFAEAKKPSVNISRHADSAFQLRRYGWSADLPVSILTNFEYFSVYDCTIKPLNSDSIKKAQLKIISYENYLDEFDYIWDRFSKGSILKDSLITYFGAKKKKKGTASVDEDFLNSLDGWRIALAKDISKNNDIDEDQLNFIVQQTIDRIIFLRIAEDRDVEDYGTIQKCLNHEGHYKHLYRFFEKADQKYNSGIFKKDDLSARIKISDSITSKIINGLYYPKSPYEFSVLPIEILGKAYEQFLGKKITLTDSGRIKIEDKPEVKKAEGVYYTPKYIVDYIVQNTVGRHCEGKTPEQVAKIKILDPASGSGSFLIGAYEYLLQWYKDYFTKNPTKYTKKKMSEIFTPTGELTTKFKGKVLLDNIYGVDIDANAVEVTKLSLLLKCMEGETKETIHAQQSLFHERILPTLDDNIKCGNSLIDFDIYVNFSDLGNDLKIKRKINAFNWKNGFKKIFENGGFDVVIGNPPYGFHQIHLDVCKDYFRAKFQAAVGSFENYFLFYEQSLKLLRPNGKHGFIAPVTWLTIPSAHALRRLVLDNYLINEIIWFKGLVFKEAQVNTLIAIIENSKNPRTIGIKIYNSADFLDPHVESYNLNQMNFNSDTRSIDIFIQDSDRLILEKIKKISTPLGLLTKPCSGYNPYEVGKGIKPSGGLHTEETVRTRPYHSISKLDNTWKPEISGKDLKRFFYKHSEKQWVKYGTWLAAARDSKNFLGPRILVQEITGGDQRRIVAAFCDEEIYYSRDVIPVKQTNDKIDLKFFLGIINSDLMTWYHHRKNPKAKKNLFPKVLVSDLKAMPICIPNLDDRNDARLYQSIVEVVNKLISLYKDIYSNPSSKTSEEISFFEDHLNELIYNLYDLSEEEKLEIKKVFREK
ncbi:MAG: N-6 DNA methylase [Oligoflexia bacterium]|nr:N-6 DNA methylase [Oligoflexia bacterium]